MRRVVTGLVEKGETDASLSGQKREITVLFSDIQGFTSLSERKSAPEIVDLLNRYFSLQVEVIFRHQGTLDKYIGDAIMAFWGAPTDQPDHARRALECAREMEQTLLRFRQELGPEGENFNIGIGLHTGEAVVGFIGSPVHRQDYTVIGDTVNTASRIRGRHPRSFTDTGLGCRARRLSCAVCFYRSRPRYAQGQGRQDSFEPTWETS